MANTANWPPPTTSDQSPSPMQVVAAAAGQGVAPAARVRTSKDHARPGAIAVGAVRLADGAPARRNRSVGVALATAVFWMTRRVVRPPSAFRITDGTKVLSGAAEG